MSCTTMFLLFTAVVCSVAAATSGCQFDFYYNRQARACVQCSRCPPDQVVNRQCYGEFDTLCGPFPRFNFADTNANVNSDVSKHVDTVVQSNAQGTPSAHPQESSNEKDKLPANTHQQTTSEVVVSDEESEDRWFVITVVLVGVLVLTCIVMAVACLVFCVAYKKKQREIVCEPSYTIPLTNKDDYPMIERYQIIRET